MAELQPSKLDVAGSNPVSRSTGKLPADKSECLTKDIEREFKST